MASNAIVLLMRSELLRINKHVMLATGSASTTGIKFVGGGAVGVVVP